MARLAQPPSRQSRFVEEKSFAALTTVLRSEGTLAFRKPDHLEKVTTSPQYESLVVDGDRLVVGAGNDAPRVVELAGQPAIRTLIDTLRGALSGDLTALRRTYAVSGTGTPADWRIVLRPLDPAVGQLVREVRLTGGADIGRIETVAANGDLDTVTVLR